MFVIKFKTIGMMAYLPALMDCPLKANLPLLKQLTVCVAPERYDDKAVGVGNCEQAT